MRKIQREVTRKLRNVPVQITGLAIQRPNAALTALANLERQRIAESSAASGKPLDTGSRSSRESDGEKH